MAIDRYQAIVHPLSMYSWTPRSGLIHMMGVWCLSLLLASPQLFIFRLDHHPAYEKKTCMAKFLGSNRTWELIYIAWTIILQFLFPICILIYCYSSVYIIINRNFSMYRTSDNLKTTNISNLPSIGITKSLKNNHVHIHYPSAQCRNITAVTFFNKTPSHNIRDIMYPVVYRLRRSQFDLAKNQSINSMDGRKSRQRFGSNHFLSRARLKTIKLTFIVVLTYILCSTPFYIGSIIMVLHGKFISQKTMSIKNLFFLVFFYN
jgi:7 transmembrane receptor (rhodopsin family)